MVDAGTPILVTVVGGYLGAGKTTLINHLLATVDEPFAVLVNDFGAVNIDAELIESDDGATITLANGCICCSLVDGFAAALDRVRSLPAPPHRVLIEASGVANPAQVAAHAHRPGFALDGVVVLADGLDFEQQLRSELIGDVVRQQLRDADLIVMTKVDLVPAEHTAVQRSAVEALVPAPVLESSMGRLPETVLFGPEPMVDRASDVDLTVPPGGSDLFESWDETTVEPLDRAVLEQQLASLPEHVVRAKGIVRFAESPERTHLVQVVGKRWSITERGPGDGQPSTVVFIARKASPKSHR